ncbi:MAG TPA: trimethylamine methyltransferase family protein [Firmicutes bacterium]|nr:trimethylamine methyltransferase family protein [Bacillota bacterium]
MTLTGVIPALAGANLIYGLGMLDSALTWDYAQMVMHNEFARMIKRVVGGIELNDETMQADLIAEVGPGGEFITREHTFKNMRQLSQTELIDRRTRRVWQEEGGTDIVERAYEKSHDILENYKVDPLPEEMQRELKSILADADAEAEELQAKGLL